MIPPIDQLQLDKNDQSGWSKLYVLERLVRYYGGDNCLIDENGWVDEELGGTAKVDDPGPVVLPVTFDLTGSGAGARLFFKPTEAPFDAHIMYTEEVSDIRFPPLDMRTPDHLVMVRYNAGNWEAWDTGGTWTTFTPVATDRLLYEFDMITEIPTDLIGTDTTNNGIRSGYISSDLVLGGINPGAFIQINTATFFTAFP